MSLFANDQYRWRETYSVLFREADRPSAGQLRKALEGLGEGYRVTDITTGADGTGRGDDRAGSCRLCRHGSVVRVGGRSAGAD